MERRADEEAAETVSGVKVGTVRFAAVLATCSASNDSMMACALVPPNPVDANLLATPRTFIPDVLTDQSC